MCTSGEKVRISDEAERVQSVSYSHFKSIVRALYSGFCKEMQAKHLPHSPRYRGPPQGISHVNITHFW